MNSIPGCNCVTPKDGRTMNELGKELGAAHDLYCAFRDIGGTPKDIRAITGMRDALQKVIFRSRGILPAEESVYDMILNLDASTNINRDRNNPQTLIVDQRLGMWVMELNNPEGYIVGDKQMVFICPLHKECMHRGRFDRKKLGYFDGRIDLNAQAAEALAGNPMVLQNIFSDLSPGEDWKDEKIFFLGTVWMQEALVKGNSGTRHGWDICAKALVCSSDGAMSVVNEPLPVGKWPSNYYIALLIPYYSKVSKMK